MKLRTMLQGAGFAALLLFPFFNPVIVDPSGLRMHSSASPAGFAFSLVVNLFLLAIAVACLGRWLRGNPSLQRLYFILPGLLFVLLIKAISSARAIDLPLHRLAEIFFAIAVASLVLQWKWRKAATAVFQITGAILVGLSMFFIFAVWQLARVAAWRHAPNSTQNMTAENAASANAPRVVWILFDEISYRQVFGDRFAGLQLPNFDRLRASSTVFNNVQPVGNRTEKAVPSILLGRPIVRIDYTPADVFEVASKGQSLKAFNAAQTPFALAQQHGLTTGVVGWYNPYCSILAPYLNSCYWTFRELLPSYQLGDSVLKDIAVPWLHYGLVLRQLWNSKYRTTDDLQFRIDTYRDLTQRSDAMLRQSSPDFVFLHLPLPHPPGFYNRKTGRIEAFGNHSYIDNLALADKTLGQFLAILEQSPRWKNTSVVICGDHSWRTWIWDRSRDWTGEDEAASHGHVFDPRPLLMVHTAGQTAPAEVTSPFPLVELHGILDHLITGKQPSF